MCSISSSPFCLLLLIIFFLFPTIMWIAHIYLFLSCDSRCIKTRKLELNEEDEKKETHKKKKKKWKIVCYIEVEKLKLIASSFTVNPYVSYSHLQTRILKPYIYKFIYIYWIKITFEHVNCTGTYTHTYAHNLYLCGDDMT